MPNYSMLYTYHLIYCNAISLFIQSITPYKVIGLTGSVLKSDPLFLEAVLTNDNEEKLKATLDLQQNMSQIRLDFGTIY